MSFHICRKLVIFLCETDTVPLLLVEVKASDSSGSFVTSERKDEKRKFQSVFCVSNVFCFREAPVP